jgi:hypothetical protein
MRAAQATYNISCPVAHSQSLCFLQPLQMRAICDHLTGVIEHKVLMGGPLQGPSSQTNHPCCRRRISNSPQHPLACCSDLEFMTGGKRAKTCRLPTGTHMRRGCSFRLMCCAPHGQQHAAHPATGCHNLTPLFIVVADFRKSDPVQYCFVTWDSAQGNKPCSRHPSLEHDTQAVAATR